ncbi:MAG TPA: hypothetical protein VF017_20690 [Thermoanaerobaculia bacterium]|nr:hypothetical protein [Thermoanaerobaculia bacterium]
MKADRIAVARLLRALSHAELPPPFEKLATGRAEQRPLALALQRLAEKASLAEIQEEVSAVVARLEELGGKEGKDSARRLVSEFWKPLLAEVERQLKLAEEPLGLFCEVAWEGIDLDPKSALRKELVALCGRSEPRLGGSFFAERLRLRLRAKARQWLDDDRRDRAAPKGDR